MTLPRILLLWVSLALASCGGGGNSGAGSAPTVTAPASTPVTALEAQFKASDCVAHNPFSQPIGASATLCRSGYSVGYSNTHKQAAWVSYYLNAELVNRQIARTEDFREDPSVPAMFRATLADYAGSGFDRGHLASAATVGFDRVSMSESFLLSNMSPQLPVFNRGGWAELEEKIRECMNKTGDLLVISGPVFQSPNPIRINRVGPTVPDRFYNLIVKLSTPRQAFAVSIKHDGFVLSDLGDFVVSPDELELQTGLNFLAGLDDSEENAVEAGSVDFCGLIPVSSPTVSDQPTQPTQPTQPSPTPNVFGPCGSKTSCSQMRSCAEANFFYRSCGVSRLDGDNDGVPCEALCR